MTVGGSGDGANDRIGTKSEVAEEKNGKDDDTLTQLTRELAEMKERFARIESLLAKAKKEK